MSVTWTNEIEMEFLEYYKAEPILWDPKQRDHKNKLKIHDAWMRISSIMDISIPELKRKRDSLLSSYRSYRLKIKKSIRSGAGVDEVYKPVWFAYELMDAFLGDTTKCNKTINTISTNRSVNFQHAKKRDKSDQQKTIFLQKAVDHLDRSSDEGEIYGQAWASEYKKLTTEQQLYAKKHIDDILFQGRLGKLTEHWPTQQSSSLRSSTPLGLVSHVSTENLLAAKPEM